jgi:hypothetical protein
MGEKRRYFSREFKRNAVQLVTEKGMTVGKVTLKAYKKYSFYGPSILGKKRRRGSKDNVNSRHNDLNFRPGLGFQGSPLPIPLPAMPKPMAGI